jgi:hypothetical protein
VVTAASAVRGGVTHNVVLVFDRNGHPMQRPTGAAFALLELVQSRRLGEGGRAEHTEEGVQGRIELVDPFKCVVDELGGREFPRGDEARLFCNASEGWMRHRFPAPRAQQPRHPDPSEN